MCMHSDFRIWGYWYYGCWNNHKLCGRKMRLHYVQLIKIPWFPWIFASYFNCLLISLYKRILKTQDLARLRYPIKGPNWSLSGFFKGSYPLTASTSLVLLLWCLNSALNHKWKLNSLGSCCLFSFHSIHPVWVILCWK